MQVINVRNVQEALPVALDLIKDNGVERDSRNGKVTVFSTPVTTVYERPQERVIFWAERDANPFFHLFESLWMLAGRNDVAYPATFVRRMKTYSDDGQVFNAAYGFRWRNHFGIDQLEEVIQILKKDPESRQAVIQMWDYQDLTKQTKDKACNTLVQFQINYNGCLDMQVSNRSNDIVWGAYGANAVHFSYLMEYVAASLGVPLGCYYQISNNFHAYHDTLKKVECLADHVDKKLWQGVSIPNPYVSGDVEPYPLINGGRLDWLEDLKTFLEYGANATVRDPFFKKVAIPMLVAFQKQAKGEYHHALESLKHCAASDWRMAAEEWVLRRMAKKEKAA